MTSANAEFFMYLLWCNEDRADNDDILWLIKNERNYEASEWLKNLIRDGFDVRAALQRSTSTWSRLAVFVTESVLTASENPVWGFYGIRLRP